MKTLTRLGAILAVAPCAALADRDAVPSWALDANGNDITDLYDDINPPPRASLVSLPAASPAASVIPRAQLVALPGQAADRKSVV